MSEVIFQSGTITITSTLAKFGSDTYPIANIGSIKVGVEPKNHGGGAALVAAIAGIVCGFFGGAGVGIVVGITVFIGLLIVLGRAPVEKTLTFKTSSGDVTALKTTDVNLIEGVKSAIESAFVRP
ncbi:DUF6232 family protein [Agrobacterium sp. DSM 25558]|uniref:DUF6232 family protein n=1 Tax=Agrobacterium sp. DSM 25558 TaxID=1907665 RepID=UPI00097DBF9D|nr:DUF6232 family protein [Agrobacterium sp. DSM 25558]